MLYAVMQINPGITVLLTTCINYVGAVMSKVPGTSALMNAWWSFALTNLSCQVMTKYFPMKVDKW